MTSYNHFLNKLVHKDKWCKTTSRKFKEDLLRIFADRKDLKCIESIRGYGFLGGIDIQMREKPGKAGFQVYKECYRAGLNIKPTGDALIIAPPFICEKKHIDEIVEKLRKGISNFIKS